MSVGRGGGRRGEGGEEREGRGGEGGVEGTTTPGFSTAALALGPWGSIVVGEGVRDFQVMTFTLPF
jgi:hypothetical protein